MTIKQSLSSSVLESVFAKPFVRSASTVGTGDLGVHDLLQVGSVLHKDILLEPLYSAQEIHVGEYSESPIEFVKHLIDGASGAGSPNEEVDTSHPIFCEMMGLSPDAVSVDSYIWIEAARWIKYEETVEEGGKRWSKPHVSMLTLPSLLQLRNCFKRGVTLLDVDADNLTGLFGTIIASWESRGKVEQYEVTGLTKLLSAPKQHLVGSQFRDRLSRPTSIPEDPELVTPGRKRERQLTGKRKRRSSSDGHKSDGDDGSENQVRKQDSADGVVAKAGPSSSIMRKVPDDAESAVLFVAQLDEYISTPLVAFVRLLKAKRFGDVPEVDIPTRFVFILLAPTDHSQKEIDLIGRCLGTLLVDKVFSMVAYRAKNICDLCYGIDEFLSQIVVVPAGKWCPTLRWEPSDEARTVVRRPGKPMATRKMSLAPPTLGSYGIPMELQRTGRLFGGLVEDTKRKASFYLSDFTDAFRGTSVIQCLAAAIFLFFANVTKIITFGGVMESMLDSQMASMENLLSGGICGVSYALFSGQPLSVLSATGPTLVFEFILYRFCKDHLWDFLLVRFWVGTWTALIIMILIALDASVMVAWITRFTEEAFATLISVIFIIQAFEELFHIIRDAPLTTDPEAVIDDPCVCYGNETGINFTITNDNMSASCSKIYHGELKGLQCNFLPDVFLFSVLIFIGTFSIAYGLKHFRNSGFLPARIRQIISDFNVLISIIMMTSLNILVGLEVPKLHVPEKFAPTFDRNWFLDPFAVDPWWLGLVAFIPAILFTILVVMDQQITSVIVNRKENKLKKGYGYNLDLLVIAFLMLLCGLLGIPYYVAATVISIMHVDSLKVMSECAAPGDKPQFLGVREQRVTAIIAHIFIGLAVFLTPIIRLVPLPVLLGIFLYMGIVSLSGQQFVQRIRLFFIPVKYQPDYRFLRLVPLRRVHFFTVIQVIGLLLLFAVKYTKQIAMLFPVMLIVMMVIRRLLEYCFSQKELLALDDPLPAFMDLWRPKKESGSPITAPLTTFDRIEPNAPLLNSCEATPESSSSQRQQRTKLQFRIGHSSPPEPIKDEGESDSIC